LNDHDGHRYIKAIALDEQKRREASLPGERREQQGEAKIFVAKRGVKM
jgi:hypothetical protein